MEIQSNSSTGNYNNDLLSYQVNNLKRTFDGNSLEAQLLQMLNAQKRPEELQSIAREQLGSGYLDIKV